jgi:Acetyltransferase (GNAT) domain
MRNSDAPATSVELAPEDQLWSGLAFEVMEKSEMPAQHTAGGDQVHYHRGVWWKQLNRCFCMPCSLFEDVDPRESWPDPRHALAGYLHLSPPGTESNATYPAIVNDQVKHYSVKRLASKRKSGMIRGALGNVAVQPVSVGQLLRYGYEVYWSWHHRVAWGRDRTEASFREWILRASGNPKRMVLGAFVEEKLVAFMLPYATGRVVAPSFLASHTDYLKYRPNDVLYHAMLCIARQTPGITMADFGPLCSKATLNEFKLRFGNLREFPAYAIVHPFLRLFAAERMRLRYPWLVLKTQGER